MQAPVLEGEVLAGKYRVERVLGVGGMGVVVAATDLGLDRRVAIKFLLPDAAVNPEVVARFVREARSAVKIESEHVARVIDVGELPGGRPYMVMEYLQGSDLSDAVAKRGPFPADEAVEYVLQACEAIAEAHALGIVHRDLKPANLFLARRPDGSSRIKVLDFGISKATTAPGAAPDMGLTKTSAVMGSPLYMAPEQMRSTRNVDVRADVWALGVILYELLSGHVPFEATTMPELCALVLTEPTPPLAKWRADLPSQLCAVIERCLVKDPEQRWANVAQLAHALMPFAPGRAHVSVERISKVLRAAGVSTESVRAPVPQTTLVANARTGDSTDTTWNPATTGAAQPNRRLATAIGVGVIALAAVIGVVALTRRSSSVPDAPSSAAAEPAAVTSVAAPQAVTAEPPSVVPAPEPAVAAAPSVVPSASAAAAAVPSTPSRAPRATARTPAPAAKPNSAPPPPVATPPPAPASKKNPLDIGLK